MACDWSDLPGGILQRDRDVERAQRLGKRRLRADRQQQGDGQHRTHRAIVGSERADVNSANARMIISSASDDSIATFRRPAALVHGSWALGQ